MVYNIYLVVLMYKQILIMTVSFLDFPSQKYNDLLTLASSEHCDETSQ